jgi:surface protein
MFRQVGGFNQPVGNWNVSNITNFANFMADKSDADYSVANYDALLNGWASRPVVSGRSISFGTIKYSAAASASRAILTSSPNSWTIVDGGQV